MAVWLAGKLTDWLAGSVQYHHLIDILSPWFIVYCSLIGAHRCSSRVAIGGCICVLCMLSWCVIRLDKPGHVITLSQTVFTHCP